MQSLITLINSTIYKIFDSLFHLSLNIYLKILSLFFIKNAIHSINLVDIICIHLYPFLIKE